MAIKVGLQSWYVSKADFHKDSWLIVEFTQAEV